MVNVSDLTANQVVICGEVVNRPSYVSPSQWFEFWEGVIELEGKEEDDD